MSDNILMPCIPLRGLIVYPKTVLHFDIGREKSIKALETAMETDKLLFVAPQMDDSVLIPTADDFYHTGTVVKVKQMLKIQGDGVRVLVDGLYRAKIDWINSGEPYFRVAVTKADTVTYDDSDLELQALKRLVLASFDEYIDLSDIKAEAYELVAGIDDQEIFCDTVATQMTIRISQKQEILEALDVKERLKILNRIISEENEIPRLELDLNEKVQDSIKKNQKEYFLHEQMKLDKLELEDKYKEKVKREISKFTKMGPNSADAAVIRNYVETIVGLPWQKSSKVNSDLRKAEKILNEDHYGMDKVKERILEYLAVIHLNKAIKGPIICLVGPPGVGKTSIAKSIARATGREFTRMSLGGVRDEAEISFPV